MIGRNSRAVKGTSRVEMMATTSAISPSSPTSRAKAGEEVAAQPVAVMTSPAASGPWMPSAPSAPQAISGQALVVQGHKDKRSFSQFTLDTDDCLKADTGAFCGKSCHQAQ